jgi:hypothetical protein
MIDRIGRRDTLVPTAHHLEFHFGSILIWPTAVADD